METESGWQVGALAEGVGAAFAPYLDDALGAVRGLLGYFHEDVRQANDDDDVNIMMIISISSSPPAAAAAAAAAGRPRRRRRRRRRPGRPKLFDDDCDAGSRTSTAVSQTSMMIILSIKG